MRKLFHLAIVCSALTTGGVVLAAQGGRLGARGGVAPDEATVSPAEIQRMFDSYALMQAQEQLQIGDDRFPQFLTRFKALQDVRRRGLQERARMVQDLRRLVNDPQSDEAQIKDRLKSLDELDARSDGDVRKASDAINQMLDVRQQAKFRVFEENMERRKLELVTRARQANRKQQQKPQ
jgi:Spy/CpxP family protein refolding chaperone